MLSHRPLRDVAVILNVIFSNKFDGVISWVLSVKQLICKCLMAWWPLRFGSTLAQVMACCLMAPSHYLNQCWLVISKVQKHSYEKNFTTGQWINSLWPNDAIWRHGTGSTLAQVMACCLMAPSHYLSQCWLIISKVLCHSLEGIIMRRSEDTNQ